MPGKTINIPHVGRIPTGALVGVGVGAAAFIGWRWWSSRQALAASAADTTDTTGSEFDLSGDGGTLPSVPDAFGLDTIDSGSSTTGSTPTGFVTNAAWSQDAAAQLEQGDAWSYSDIVTALGNYLSSQPLTSVQKSIVQAAIAIDGPPPVGTFPIISGGDVPLSVAPSGLQIGHVDSSSIQVEFQPVAGAAYYQAYRSGASGDVGSGPSSPITVSGLAPNTTYSLTVAAVSAAGAVGPHSSSISAKTTAVTLKTPSAPKVSGIATTSATVTTGAVSGATGYNWYVGGVAHGHSDNPSYKLVGLKARTRYSVRVAADNASQAPGPQSASTTFTTK